MFWSGFRKVASFKLKVGPSGHMGFKPIAVPVTGRVGHRASSVPKRVTSSITPGNPIQGLRGLTGAPEARPWKHIVSPGRRK